MSTSEELKASTAGAAAPAEPHSHHGHLSIDQEHAHSHSGLSTSQHRRNASALSSKSVSASGTGTLPSTGGATAASSPVSPDAAQPSFQEIAQKAVISAVKNVDQRKLDQHPDSDSEDEHDRQRQRVAQMWAVSAPSTPYRHLYVDWPHQAIKKTFTIGASAEDPNPPIYDLPLREVTEKSAASCMLVTKGSPIQATVHIIKGLNDNGDKNLGKPVSVSAKTVMGPISLRIPDYTGSRPLHIRAKTTKGDIAVFLPPTFAGLLTWTSETGTLKLSEAIQARYKRLDEKPHKHRGTAKIVPSVASGNRGDACEIINRGGSITILEAGEDRKKSDSCLVM